MDAAAEAGMGVEGAGRVECVGVFEAGGVAVCGAEHQADDIALFQGNTTKVEIFKRVAGEHVEGRVETQHFFDEAFGAGGVIQAGAGVDLVFENGFDGIADGVDGGFVAGIEDENAGRDQFVF